MGTPGCKQNRIICLNIINPSSCIINGVKKDLNIPGSADFPGLCLIIGTSLPNSPQLDGDHFVIGLLKIDQFLNGGLAQYMYLAIELDDVNFIS